MWVASGEWSTSTGSKPKDSTPSKIRSPEPSSTGAISRVSLVDHPRGQRLSHGRGPAGDVHALVPGGLTRCGVGSVEALGDEVKVVPPAIRIGARRDVSTNTGAWYGGSAPHQPDQSSSQSPADGAEHVPPHHVRTPRAHEPATRGCVGVSGARVAEVPGVRLQPAPAQGVVPALVRPGDEAVERDRHVAGRVRHGEPPRRSHRSADGRRQRPSRAPDRRLRLHTPPLGPTPSSPREGFRSRERGVEHPLATKPLPRCDIPPVGEAAQGRVRAGGCLVGVAGERAGRGLAGTGERPQAGTPHPDGALHGQT